jgi:hypothetical protein
VPANVALLIRVFRGDCGTPLYVQVGTRPDLVGLRVRTPLDPGWFKPDADIFMKSAQPWDHDQPPGARGPITASVGLPPDVRFAAIAAGKRIGN